MSRLPGVTGNEVIAAPNRMGFQEIRIRGSHHQLRHPDGRASVVSAHAGETIGGGLRSKILRDAKISRDDLRAKL